MNNMCNLYGSNDYRALSAGALQHFWIGSLLALTATLIGGATAVAQDDRNGTGRDFSEPSITVSGVGEVQAKPDSVAINLGVVTEAETAEQALTANSEAMQQLFDALEREQIAEKDRQTRRFDISPQYRQEPPEMRDRAQDEASREPRIVGYQVINEVRVQVREVSRLGTVLDAVVSAGSNRIHGIEFLIENRAALLDDARRLAIQRAQRKANLMAEAAGASVGKVLKIREEGLSQPMPQGRQMAMMEAQSVPIAEGQQTLTARVELVYQLNP